MKLTRILAAAAALTLFAGACGGGGGSGTAAGTYKIDKQEFPAGSTMERLQKAGKIKVGVKYDQPGNGEKDPATGKLTGFDIEIGRMTAADLGIEEKGIEWVETVSANRETALANGTVDIIIATYTINEKRKQLVSFAGPYYVAGGDLLVRKDDSSITGVESTAGKTVCSVKGSTSLENIKKLQPAAKTVEFDKYSLCLEKLQNKEVDAMTTDDTILKGYAAQQPDKLKVVNKPFTQEPYGIGLKKGDNAFQKFLNESIKKHQDNGDWKKGYDATLGKSGAAAPAPPALTEN